MLTYFNFYGFKLDTIVTDILSSFGLFLIVFSPFIILTIIKKMLKSTLHTKKDGDKLFEKLKYDLKLSKITKVNRNRLYNDQHYAQSIFRGAMEYNSRDVVWYYNEFHAKNFISRAVSNYAWYHLLMWIICLGTIAGGSLEDGLRWMWKMKEMTNTSGIVSIWVLFIIAYSISFIIKIFEYHKINSIINDNIRQINSVKKAKILSEYKIIYGISFSLFVLGFIFIFINIWF